MEAKHLCLHRQDISYVKFILEGYDGLGILTTLDRYAASAVITYPASQSAALTALIDALRQEGILKEEEA